MMQEDLFSVYLLGLHVEVTAYVFFFVLKCEEIF